MTLLAYLAGSDEAHRIKIGDMGLSSRADSTGAFGQIIFDDPDGTLSVRGFMHVLVVEDASTDAPDQHWGWIWTRTYKRGPYKHGPGRIIDCQVLDPNYVLNHRLITNLDGKRPAETDIERIDWLLGSPYCSGLIDDFGLVNRSSPHPMEDADYIGQYPAQVLQDLCGQLYKTFFAYVDEEQLAIGLFYDLPPSNVATSTLSISNVMSDVSDTCYFPFLDVEVARDPSEVYAKMRFKYRNGVVLGQNSDIYDEFFADTGLGYRGVQVESTRVGLESTARARIQTLLARGSKEQDTITCSIEIEPANVGLIQAGDRLLIRLSHMANEGYDPAVYSRVTARTIRQLRSDLYQMDLELNMAGVTSGAGGGGGSTGDFPHNPGALTIVQMIGGNGSLTMPDPIADGDTLLYLTGVRSTTFQTLTGYSQSAEGETVNGVTSDKVTVYRKVASGESQTLVVLNNDQGGLWVELAGEWDFDQHDGATGSGTAFSAGPITVTPNSFVWAIGGIGDGGGFDHATGYTLQGQPGWIEAYESNVFDGHPRIWVGYQTTTTGGSFTGSASISPTDPFQWEAQVISLTGGIPEQNPPDPAQPVGPETVTMVGPDGTTQFPFADGSLHVFVDNTDQTAAIVSYDGACGEFTLAFTPTPTEVVVVFYQGR